MVVDVAPEPVAGADLEVLHLVEDVQLHQCDGPGAVDADCVAGHGGVEPAHAPGSAGHGAEFVTALANGVARRVGQLGREGTVADAGRIGLHDGQRLVDFGRRYARAGAGAPGGRI